ncbi:DUF6468 domain-containing protein [Sphingomonas hylomeconis]|uniref:DUF6468 domain-containing protein n=1 Tax=Sphingomonas hylomeconis TaxID=1395958 RepID=A0ABV7SSQ2_9SPHN|nr:DUF6468 domain-containing protein [Sphingomonas hylomeconis]
MTFSTIADLVTTALCVAVIVQMLRVKRSLDAVRRGDLGHVVAALDQSTVQARIVLSELKGTLERCTSHAETTERGREVLDELRLMVELADGAADRLIAASSARTAAGKECAVA